MGVGFLPVVVGPSADRLSPQIALQAMFGEDSFQEESTDLDFDIAYEDARLFTLHTSIYFTGASSSADSRTVSYRWDTGVSLGIEVFRADRIHAVLKLADAKVHASWRAHKAALMKETAEGTCGRDQVGEGDGPSVTKETLTAVVVDGKGISLLGPLSGEVSLPSAYRACEPQLDRHLAWAEVRSYLDAAGTLGSY
jgi:hypothetical protein